MRRSTRFGRRRDSFGRDTSTPYWWRRLDRGQQCECDVDKWNIKRSEQKYGHSDSLVKYMKCECPRCGETFGWSDYVIEG